MSAANSRPLRDQELTGTPGYAAYEMRQLRTEAERAEAEALVTDRHIWLTRRHRPCPAATSIASRFRQEPAAVGMFENGGRLVCCLVLDQTPAEIWLRHVYSAPGSTSNGVARLLTLWAADHAAQNGLAHVHVEALLAEGIGTPSVLITRYITYLHELGWTTLRISNGPVGARVVHLRVPAKRRPAIQHLVRFALPVEPSDS
ncbi:hypothetical protein [Streptomyces seoulensis]|uniref:hypothetical protein n=1 Tax=Streptomyces seoulensis TaxID=73044 RepID=UPI001FCB9C49|nr:hypothetical protein [Streptomyces seoulensis]BDH07149.1 hypothetical protein HEK131_43760 [Streptomyces seoulensis]